jgi:hypothetical protein
MKRVIFKINNTLCVIRLGKTTNTKIAALGEKVVQTYHFSKGQFDTMSGAPTMEEFFSHDRDVCLSCPLAMSNGAKRGDCYTREFNLFRGFKSMLRSVRALYTWDALPELNADMERDILKFAAGRFVRFGTYGEPSLLPIELTRTICAVAKNWTGYTHQYKERAEFAPYFMASTHSEEEEQSARLNSWRSFVATKSDVKTFVHCPASKEMNYKSNCSKCGLCSGTSGKGNKSVNILLH